MPELTRNPRGFRSGTGPGDTMAMESGAHHARLVPCRKVVPMHAIHRSCNIAVLSLILIAAAATLPGCATDRQVINQANEAHAGLEPAVMDDPELTNYLQAVGNRIIAAAKQLDEAGTGPKAHTSEQSGWMFSKDMKFHFVNSKTINAFTTGGEHMYVYNELFQ